MHSHRGAFLGFLLDPSGSHQRSSGSRWKSPSSRAISRWFSSNFPGITTVLTLSTISLDSRTDLPKVRYATALDWFLLMSFLYCIATLLEFAGVHYFTKVLSGFPQAALNNESSRLEVAKFPSTKTIGRTAKNQLKSWWEETWAMGRVAEEGALLSVQFTTWVFPKKSNR